MFEGISGSAYSFVMHCGKRVLQSYLDRISALPVQSDEMLNTLPGISDIGHIPYLCSLMLELHCPLISQRDYIAQISRQCISQIRL